MGIADHATNRAWTFQALDQIEAFLDDPDFDGNRDEELAQVQERRTGLTEGKYRVVVLGEFNVGKSTLVNAFLEAEYLPTVLEECTTKITQVLREDRMRAIFPLRDAVTEEELATLRSLLASLEILATAAQTSDGMRVIISFEGENPRTLLTTLRALVTMNADADYPQLTTFRTKFDEVVVHLPGEVVAEDVVLVDSPGVHTISETNRRVTEEFIPKSHLVICLLDCQSAGDANNRTFIENLVRTQRKRVFFVINKSDQLNPDEIDVTGHRGPAKDLLRSLEGIVQDPEVFFVSSLSAVAAEQLLQKEITLDDIEANAKTRLPNQMYNYLAKCEDPIREAAEFLAKRSRVPELKQRVFEYLYNENREGAVVETVCEYLTEATWRFTRPLEVLVDLTRNNPRLVDLRKCREALTQTLESQTGHATSVLEAYQAASAGGTVDGVHHEGYRGIVEARIAKHRVDEAVVKPLREWLESPENLKLAKRDGYQPLLAKVQETIDAFRQGIGAELESKCAAAEAHARDGASAIVRHSESLSGRATIETTPASVEAIDAGMGKSYAGFAAVGAVLGGLFGAGIGAAVWTLPQVAAWLPPTLPATNEVGAAVGAGAGVLLGIVAGLALRARGSDEVRRRRLNDRVAEQVEKLIMNDYREHMIQAVEGRRAAFRLALQGSLDRVTGETKRQIAEIEAEEAKIRAVQDESIGRIEPKIEALRTLGNRAREIAAGLHSKLG